MISKLFNLQFVIASVIIFLVSDLLLVIFPTLVNYNISHFLKGSILLIYLAIAIKLFHKREFFFLVVIIVIFVTSQSYLFLIDKINNEGIMENLRFFTWYFFGIILVLFYKKACATFQDYKSVDLLNKVALLIISVICISVLIGFIFDLKMFWSYKGSRWGFKGILSKSVNASYFFIIALNYLYYCYVILKRKYSFFLVVLFCSLLCGTKTIYFYIVLLLVFNIVYENKFKLKSFWYIFATLLALFFTFKSVIIEKTEFLWGLSYRLYQEKGFLYSFTSLRSEGLIEGINHYYLHWDWLNYLFGGRLSEIKYFEMAFFDLFYFFGIVGFMLFIFILINYIFIPFLNQTKVYGFFIIFSVFLASFFTGQFFNNSTIIILVFYYLLVINVNTKFNEPNQLT